MHPASATQPSRNSGNFGTRPEDCHGGDACAELFNAFPQAIHRLSTGPASPSPIASKRAAGGVHGETTQVDLP